MWYVYHVSLIYLPGRLPPYCLQINTIAWVKKKLVFHLTLPASLLYPHTYSHAFRFTCMFIMVLKCRKIIGEWRDKEWKWRDEGDVEPSLCNLSGLVTVNRAYTQRTIHSQSSKAHWFYQHPGSVRTPAPPHITPHSLYNWNQYWLSSLNCLSLTVCFRSRYTLKVFVRIEETIKGCEDFCLGLIIFGFVTERGNRNTAWDMRSGEQ